MQWGGSKPALPGAHNPWEQIAMRTFASLQSRNFPSSALLCVMLSGVLIAAAPLSGISGAAQSTSQPAASPTTSKSQQAQVRKSHAHPPAKKQDPPPVAQAPPPPPMPDWPANDKPSPASVVWDATGLRINASNSSLQQILSEISTETGSKVEGMGADQRVYGVYGPGQARDVLSQLLQGSGYNVLLAGDIGQGAPRQIVLSPRQNGPAGAPAGMNRPQQDQEEDIPEQPEDQPQPPVQAPQTQNPVRPGFGPNGPIRTPQQVMEEMQQRQLQQQQMQQQPQQQPQPQTAPQTNPQ
jgi:hypothetical protein